MPTPLRLPHVSLDDILAAAQAGEQGADEVFVHGAGPVIESPNATKYRLVVANDGTVSATAI